MPTITVRNVPPKVVQSLKALAKRHNRSMEQEARDLLEKAVELDPNFELAWYKLGLAHTGDCDAAELKRIAAVLLRLDQQLHARLLQAGHPATDSRPKSFAC